MSVFLLRLYEAEWTQTLERLITEEDPIETARLQGKAQGLRRAVDLPYILLESDEVSDARRQRDARRTG